MGIGDIVFLACKVVGRAKQVYSLEPVLDVVVIGTENKRVDFTRNPIRFSVFEADVRQSSTADQFII